MTTPYTVKGSEAIYALQRTWRRGYARIADLVIVLGPRETSRNRGGYKRTLRENVGEHAREVTFNLGAPLPPLRHHVALLGKWRGVSTLVMTLGN